MSIKGFAGQCFIALVAAAIFLYVAAPEPAGKVLALQSLALAAESILLSVLVWNWHEMVGAYQLSFRYRRVLPHGNVLHRMVHSLLEEAVSGSTLTRFLSWFLPLVLLTCIPALTAFWFAFGSFLWLAGVSAYSWLVAAVLHSVLCERFRLEYERELLLFRTVHVPEPVK